MIFSGVAEVKEWFDDQSGQFRIEVVVSNRYLGKLFGYSGRFDAEWIPTHTPPSDLFPARLNHGTDRNMGKTFMLKCLSRVLALRLRIRAEGDLPGPTNRP